MTDKIRFSCECGTLKGTIKIKDRRKVTRAICHCDDCQTFAHALGKADNILNRCAGTDLFQIAPSDLTIDEGKDQLAAMQLSPKGIFRWYTRCCKSPIANTTTAATMPFVGVLVANITPKEPAQSVDDLLGPVDFQVQGQHKKAGEDCPNIHPTFPFKLLMGIMSKIIVRRLKGEHKMSAFFNPDTLQPITEPQILTLEEREEISDRAKQWKKQGITRG